MILRCTDFNVDTECCDTCSVTPEDLTVVYPRSLTVRTAPDQSMGIKAFVCCHHIHDAKAKDRVWWLDHYLHRHLTRYTVREVNELLAAVNSPNYWKVWGDVHSRSRDREIRSIVAKRQPRLIISACPGCGMVWNDVVCNNCGFAS
jgi:hypothetical protein